MNAYHAALCEHINWVVQELRLDAIPERTKKPVLRIVEARSKQVAVMPKPRVD